MALLALARVGEAIAKRSCSNTTTSVLDHRFPSNLRPAVNAATAMIIPITLSSENSHSKLPAGLARISNDEIVLVELQGALDTGNSHPVERNGKFIGKLSIDDALVRG